MRSSADISAAVVEDGRAAELLALEDIAPEIDGAEEGAEYDDAAAA